MKRNVRAYDIKRALSQYHSDSYKSTIFFEVKNGSTYFNDNLLIMDALALKKSWKNPLLTGYEIKVSRSDFLSDEKWPGYLENCHKFYFVCPKGMISREEIEALDEEVGLIYYDESYNNCNLHTMKAPILRNIGFPNKELLYYILMSKVDRDKDPFFNSQAEYFKELVKNKNNNSKLGTAIRGKIGETIVKQERENERLERQYKKYEGKEKTLMEVIDYLKSVGVIKKFNYGPEEELEDNWKEKLDEILKPGLTPTQKTKIKRAYKELDDLI